MWHVAAGGGGAGGPGPGRRAGHGLGGTRRLESEWGQGEHVRRVAPNDRSNYCFVRFCDDRGKVDKLLACVSDCRAMERLRMGMRGCLRVDYIYFMSVLRVSNGGYRAPRGC